MEDKPSVRDSWLNGEVWNRNAIKPVVLARLELKDWTEKQARALWKQLKSIFYRWKAELGEQPRAQKQGGKSLDDAEAWECGDHRVNDYVDLLLRLVKEKYRPIEQLLRKVSLRKLLAVTTLAEAALGQSPPGLPGGGPLPDRHVQAALKGGLEMMIVSSKTQTDLALNTLTAIQPSLHTGHKVRKAMDDGRIESAKARSERKQENEAAWRKKARKEWPEHPGWTVDDMAAWLWQQWDKVGPPDDPRKKSTIKQAIKGVKSTVFKRRAKSSPQ